MKKTPNPEEEKILRFFFGVRPKPVTPKEATLAPEPKSESTGSIPNKSLLGILAGLSYKEEQELRSRSRLLNSSTCIDEMSDEQLLKQFRATRERIRQIEHKTFRKLKHPSRMCKTRTFLDEVEDDSQ